MGAGRQVVRELRARVFAERKEQLGAHVRLTLSGYADGLVAHRSTTGSSSTVRDAVARPLDLHLDAAWRSFDLRVGMSRVVWGRLDELQPTDVVNPIDLTRFLLEGRSEARLPVGVVRGRAFLPKQATVEVVLVPVFRAGRFDQLDEDTSPFDLRPGGIRSRPPRAGRSWRNLQGGARFTATVRPSGLGRDGLSRLSRLSDIHAEACSAVTDAGLARTRARRDLPSFDDGGRGLRDRARPLGPSR